MSTFIHYVGHSDPAQVDQIDLLLMTLANEPLDPMFEEFGHFAEIAKAYVVDAYNTEVQLDPPLSRIGTVHFHGNFYNYSLAFSVFSDDPTVISQITAAIRENIAMPGYKAARDERRQERHDRLQKQNRDHRGWVSVLAERCTVCATPTHASESDDDGRCAACAAALGQPHAKGDRHG